MSELDLIPQDYAREQLLRRRLRWAMVVFGALACLVMLTRSVLGVLIAAETEQVSRLQAKKLLWQQSKAKTEEYASQVLATEKQLTALDELRGRDHLRLFLEALDAAYVGNVWFDEIKYYRHESLPGPVQGAAAGARTANVAAAHKSAPVPTARLEQRAGMTGHAMNHVTLAEFMRKLETQPGVTEVSLLDTSPRRYPYALVIDFKLALLIDPRKAGRP
jgi:hypothetical protein